MSSRIVAARLVVVERPVTIHVMVTDPVSRGFAEKLVISRRLTLPVTRLLRPGISQFGREIVARLMPPMISSVQILFHRKNDGVSVIVVVLSQASPRGHWFESCSSLFLKTFL